MLRRSAATTASAALTLTVGSRPFSSRVLQARIRVHAFPHKAFASPLLPLVSALNHWQQQPQQTRSLHSNSTLLLSMGKPTTSDPDDASRTEKPAKQPGSSNGGGIGGRWPSLLLAAVVGGVAVYWSAAAGGRPATGTARHSLHTTAGASQPLTTVAGQHVYSPVSEGCRTPLPMHPQRYFDGNGHAVVPDAVKRALTENQYTVGTISSPIARIDQNSIASNDPIEDRHSEHHYRLKLAPHAETAPKDVYLLGMYDGHSGYECSDMLRTQLPKYAIQELVKRKSVEPQKVKESLTEAFLRLEKEMEAVAMDPKYAYHPKAVLPALAGAVTILSCIVDNHLYVANAGDVRAVVGRQLENGTFQAIPLSEDHDAHNPAERKRMVSEHPGEEESVLLANHRVLGGLQPTRSFGDSVYKWTQEQMTAVREGMRQGLSKPYASRARTGRRVLTPPYVTARPDVMEHELNSADRFMVLATDGIWERMSSQEVIQYVGTYFQTYICPTTSNASAGDPTSVEGNAATSLLQRALVAPYPSEKHAEAIQYIFAVPAPYSRNLRDDITVTVVFFDKVACEGLRTNHTLPVISEVDSSTWRETVEKEIQKTASKL